MLWTAGVASANSVASHAAEPVPSPTPMVLHVTTEDMLAVLKAFHFELTPKSGIVQLNVTDPSKLPAYDPLAHYQGLDKHRHPVVLASSAAKNDAATEDAIGRAVLLAVMDDNEAGPKWKSLYDQAAAADAALPANVSDPFIHRHMLAEAVMMYIHRENGTKTVK